MGHGPPARQCPRRGGAIADVTGALGLLRAGAEAATLEPRAPLGDGARSLEGRTAPALAMRTAFGVARTQLSDPCGLSLRSFRAQSGETSATSLTRVDSRPWLLGSQLLLGNDLLPLLVLALGAAMAVGNGLALLRPPPAPKSGELARAPAGRSLLMVGIGTVAAIWAVATLVSR